MNNIIKSNQTQNKPNEIKSLDKISVINNGFKDVFYNLDLSRNGKTRPQREKQILCVDASCCRVHQPLTIRLPGDGGIILSRPPTGTVTNKRRVEKI